MGARDLKDIRKQVRNVTKEILAETLSTELVANVRQELLDNFKKETESRELQLKTRLDFLEQSVNAEVKKHGERAKAVQSFLVQTVQRDLQNNMHNMFITMLAWQEIMAEKIGDPDELNAKIDAKKEEISKRLTEEKEKEMAAAIAEKQQESKEQTAEQAQASAE